MAPENVTFGCVELVRNNPSKTDFGKLIKNYM